MDHRFGHDLEGHHLHNVFFDQVGRLDSVSSIPCSLVHYRRPACAKNVVLRVLQRVRQSKKQGHVIISLLALAQLSNIV